MVEFVKVLAAAGMVMALGGTAFAAEGYKGSIGKFEMPGLTVHAYNSAEGMLDGSVVFETEKELVLLEPQSMPESAKDLKRYINGLGKPLAAVIVSYHGAGLSHYKGIPIYASKAAVEFAKDGRAAALFENFAKGVPGFDSKVVVPDQSLEGPNASIGGIDFSLEYDDVPAPAPGMTIAVPSAKVVYLHMLGGDTHSILGSAGHIEAFAEALRKMKGKGYELILTSHHVPEKPEALDKKIAYLEKTKEILTASGTKEEFVAAMKKAFPDYRGEGYLEMSAANLYK
ncbi:MBL fold metallo-hydrolase [Fretibacterium sp. OH1220_COT-178]|nr:MBL fold metallo-hydrolase [Fretibacterium sp. OH1220_COT-178]